MASNVMFFCIAFVMLYKMRMRRLVRRLSRKRGGKGWQVVWIEAPVEPVTQVMLHVYPNEENEMKKRSSRRGCLIGGGLALLLILLLGGGIWMFGTQSLTFDGAALSSVVVTITTPVNGDEANVGDFVSVTAEAVATEAVQEMELFLDGQSLGKVTDPSNASWTWQAWPLGIHSFYVQATDVKGQVGYSQVVIINVLAGDGTLDVFANPGQTLEQIGAGYGVPSDQMAGANPLVPPSQPLPEGNPLKVPIQNPEPPTVPGGNFVSVKWKIKINQPVEKSYCYVSTGNGIWNKIPKGPFTYLYGQENFYTQLIPNNGQSIVQMQCWGWVGGTLKYLGQGQGQINPSKTQGEVIIDGGGFVFTGFFKIPDITPVKTTGGNNNTVPPPFALREAENPSECASHGDPIAVPLLCNGIMNASVKKNLVLIWEWKPGYCVFGICKYGVNEIKGYGVYEINPVTQTRTLIADVKSSAMRVAFPSLPWGSKCYGVEAYVDYPGSYVSAMDTYCPGTQPLVKFISITDVTQWVTSKDAVETAGCNLGFQQENLPGSAPLIPKNWGNQPGEVHIGSYDFDSSGGPFAGSSCELQGYYDAGVKFNLGALPKGAVIKEAYLRFFVAKQSWFDGLFSGTPPGGTCISAVRTAKADWSGLVDNDHWTEKRIVEFANNSGPSASAKLNPFPQANVTAIVKSWQANPASNLGFIIFPVNSPKPQEDAQSVYCESSLGSFKLDIYYFAPP